MATHFADVSFNGLGAFSPSGTGIGYLRPDADDVDGSWTNELAGSVLFSSIDEAAPPDDDNYIQSSEDPVSDVCQVRLSNPSSLVTTPAKVRIRYKKSTASGTIYLIVRLKQGATDIAEWLYSSISDTFTTSEETLTAPQFNSITDFNDLFLEFEAVTSPLTVLIAGLTADGIFAKLDRLWIFAQPTEAEALVDLVVGATATVVNSATFTANMGYEGNGSTNYIDTNYSPKLDGVQYALNSAHLSFWAITLDVTTATNNPTAAFDTSAPICRVAFEKGAGSNFSCYVNDNTSVTAALGDGMVLGTRTGASARAIYKNGVSVVSDAQASVDRTDARVFALARSEGSSPNHFSLSQLAMLSLGAGLDSTEATNFYNRIRAYMTAVGVP